MWVDRRMIVSRQTLPRKKKKKKNKNTGKHCKNNQIEMGRKKFDKKSAQTFKLVYRSREDPLYYDEDAPDLVLKPLPKGDEAKRPNLRLKTKKELDEELKDQVRKNEGEAALYGIIYDDSSYDYMQHLKPIGEQQGVFIPKKEEPVKKKASDIVIKEPQEFLDPKLFQSDSIKEYDHRTQQDVPDEIKGFKPDMDPRLREVLIALEDEAYIDAEQDAEEGDIFDDLLKSGAAEDQEFENQDFDEWDIDNYADELAEYDSDNNNAEFDWQKDFQKFKIAQKQGKIANTWDSDDDFDSDEEEGDIVGELPDLSKEPKIAATAESSNKKKQKQRRKKGAMTDTSSFSMSSSASYRSEGLELLDDKFELIKRQYEEEDEDEDEEYQPFDMKEERQDLEGMIDDLLGNYELQRGGRRLAKKSEDLAAFKRGADSVSKGRAGRSFKKEQSQVDSLSNGVSSLKLSK